MCNIFSGHIITDKERKDFGEVLFITGLHHEKDREEIYKKYGVNIKLVAWESEEKLSLTKFKLTHSVGDLNEKEKTEYLKLLIRWGKRQNITKLLGIVAKKGGSLDLSGCDLKGITLPQSIGGYLNLSGCDLEGTTLPQSIGDSLYLSGCDLEGITLPQSIGGSLDLSGCDLKGITLPQSIGGSLYLSGCDLRDIDIPKKFNVIK